MITGTGEAAVGQKPGNNLITTTVTGGNSPVAAKVFAGNVVMVVKSLLPFLAGGAVIGVLLLAYLVPFFIGQSEAKLKAEFQSYTAKLRTDLDQAKIDAKIAKEDALVALAKLKEMQND